MATRGSPILGSTSSEAESASDRSVEWISDTQVSASPVSDVDAHAEAGTVGTDDEEEIFSDETQAQHELLATTPVGGARFADILSAVEATQQAETPAHSDFIDATQRVLAPSRHLLADLRPMGNTREPGVVDETPLKSPPLREKDCMSVDYLGAGSPRAMSTMHILEVGERLSVFAKHGSRWYPATTNGVEYIKMRRHSKASVLVDFLDIGTTTVRADDTKVLELAAGDVVNIGAGAVAHKIVDLVRSGAGGSVETYDGFDKVLVQRLRGGIPSEKHPATVVSIAELFLTARSFTHWRLSHAGVRLVMRQPPRLDLFQKPKRLRSQTQIFANCVFVVSITSDAKAKRMSEDITAHGGRALHGSLLAHFDLSFNQQSRTQTLASAKSFAAVIAEKPRKTIEFLEALALGWPCLSVQYIEDSLRAGCFLTNWSDYLLAAGHSQAVGAAVSQDVYDFSERWLKGLKLSDQLEQRRLPLGSMAMPVHFVDTGRDDKFKALLKAVCSHEPVLIKSVTDAPHGSVVIDPSQAGEPHTEAAVLRRLTRQRVLPKSLIHGREWLVQCILNHRLL